MLGCLCPACGKWFDEIAFKEIFLNMSSRVFPKRTGIWVNGLRKILLCLLCWRPFLTYCSWRPNKKNRHKKVNWSLFGSWKHHLELFGCQDFGFSSLQMQACTLHDSLHSYMSSYITVLWLVSLVLFQALEFDLDETTSIPRSYTQCLPWNTRDFINSWGNIFYKSNSQSDQLCISGYTGLTHLADLLSRVNLWWEASCGPCLFDD